MNTDEHLNNNEVAAECVSAQKYKLACLFMHITEAAKQKNSEKLQRRLYKEKAEMIISTGI